MGVDDTARTGDGLYTDKSLFLRESLKFSPKIIGVLDQIWELTDRFPKDGKIQKAEYLIMSNKLNRIFCADDDEYTADKKAEEEWARDTFGRETMDKTTFTQAWFQLADIWTEDIDVDEYYHFLQIVLRAFSEINQAGRRNFKSDENVLSFEDSEDQYYNELDSSAGTSGTDATEGIKNRKPVIAPLPADIVSHIDAMVESTMVESAPVALVIQGGGGSAEEYGSFPEMKNRDNAKPLVSVEEEDDDEEEDEEEEDEEDSDSSGGEDGSEYTDEEDEEVTEKDEGQQRRRKRRKRKKRNIIYADVQVGGKPVKHNQRQHAHTQPRKRPKSKWKMVKKTDFSSISAIITLRKIYVKLCNRDMEKAKQLLCNAVLGIKAIEESGTMQATYIRDALAYIRRRLKRKYEMKTSELSHEQIMDETQRILQQFVSVGDATAKRGSKELKIEKEFVAAWRKHKWRRRWESAPKQSASREARKTATPVAATEAPSLIVEANPAEAEAESNPSEPGLDSSFKSFTSSPTRSKQNPGPGGFRLRKALPAIKSAAQAGNADQLAQEQKMKNLSRFLIHQTEPVAKFSRFQKAVRQVSHQRTVAAAFSKTTESSSLPALGNSSPNRLPRYMQSTQTRQNQRTTSPMSRGNFKYAVQKSQATKRRALETVATFAKFKQMQTINSAKAKAQLAETVSTHEC
jgi:hypothetical protein